jgi:ATP-binding cassette subfamily F protein 3
MATDGAARLNLRIDPDDRIALLGVNGNGKSTFASCWRATCATGGEMRMAPRSSRSAHFAQHQIDELRPEWTPLEHVIEMMPTRQRGQGAPLASQPDGPDHQPHGHQAKNLSGGERARLLMGLDQLFGTRI